ncbi:MAG: permease-like cell division protein FtsX [Frankiaceae bacterium]
MRAQFILSSTLQGMRRNIGMVVSVVIVVSVSLTLIGLALLAKQQSERLKDDWYDKVEVTVYLCTDAVRTPTCPTGATEGDKQQIQQALGSLPQVQRVYYESQDQAYEEFKKTFAAQPDLVRNTDPKVLPDSYRVKLKDPKKFAVVASAVQGMTGVDSVVDAHQTLGKVFRIFDGIELSMLIMAGLVALAGVIMIIITTMLAFFGRRREVGIMRLVGASNFYIEMPFLLEGAIAGLIGALAAFGILTGLRWLFVDRLRTISLFNGRFLGNDAVLHLLPWGVLVACGVAMLAAWGTLVRYLRT